MRNWPDWHTEMLVWILDSAACMEVSTYKLRGKSAKTQHKVVIAADSRVKAVQYRRKREKSSCSTGELP